MAGLTIGWVGHSTLTIDADGRRLLTDPLLTTRVAHLRRRCPPPHPDAGDADVVLISHAHLDHLHLPSLRRVRRSARVVTPAGTRRLVERAGLRNVVEVVAGDAVDLDGFAIEVVGANHKAGRGPQSRITAEPVGYVVGTAGRRVYFPGDTDLFPAMAELGPIDVAALPIWGWGPTIGAGHLDPERATEAMATIEPGLVVPIHWGTYAPENARRRTPAWLSTPVQRFESLVVEAGHRERLARLAPGDVVAV